MKRKEWILCVFALLVGSVGIEISLGQDPPPKQKAGSRSGSEKPDLKTSGKIGARPTETAGEKPDAKSATSKKPDPVISAKQVADEEAIRLTGDAYLKAFCSGDAKSVATLFTADAEYVDERGNLASGRNAIEEVMTSLFSDNPGCEIEIEIISIRFVSPGVAIEDGITAFTSSEEAQPINSLYSAVHVKENGKWMVASVREHAPKDRRQFRAQLQQLDWLQGEWVDESEDALVVFSCEKAKGGNFLIRNFVIQVAGQEALSGKQRIGWDPIAERIRAWTFDSEGGFNDGYWHREEDRWVLKSSGFTANGQTASATSIYTPLNESRMTWQSVDREIDGIAQPDSEIVTIVRRSPKPELADDTPLPKSN
jgi:uncharacterized protein (TIGR02246 family)